MTDEEPKKPHLRVVENPLDTDDETAVEHIYETNFRDISATLRRVADQIEAGEYGYIGTAALVLHGNTLEVFGFGPACDGGSVSLLLQAGNMRMVQAVMGHGRE